MKWRDPYAVGSALVMFLFVILGVLRHDVGIGAATQLAGCATMAIAISAAWLEFRRMRAARDD